MNTQTFECIHNHPKARAMRKKQFATLVKRFTELHPEHTKIVSGWIAIDTDALDKWLDSFSSQLLRLVLLAEYVLFTEQLAKKCNISCSCKTDNECHPNHNHTIH